MQTSATVLLLVTDVNVREAVRRRLLELEVRPVVIPGADAIAAVEHYQPLAAILDEAHAAFAPDDFFAQTCAHHVRVFTLPDRRVASDEAVNALLDDVVAAQLTESIVDRPQL